MLNSINARVALVALSLVLTACASKQPQPPASTRPAAIDVAPVVTLSVESASKFKLALERIESSDFGAARQLLIEIESKEPGASGVLTNLGYVFLHQNEAETAIKYLQKVGGKGRNRVTALLLESEAYIQLHHYSEANAALEDAAEIAPLDERVFYNLGVINELYLHNNDSALKHYKKYLTLTENSSSTDKSSEEERLLVLRWVKLIERRNK